MFRETNVLDLEQMQRVLKYLETIPSATNLILELIVRTGMRSIEAVKIMEKNFDFSKNQITFKPAKNSNWRTINLDPNYCKRVRDFCAKNIPRWAIIEHAFNSKDNESLTRMLRRAWEKKRLYCLGPECTVSLHGLRHSYSLIMLDVIEKEGGNIEDLQQDLGHKSISSTAVYLQHKKRVKLRKAQDKLVKVLG